MGTIEILKELIRELEAGPSIEQAINRWLARFGGQTLYLPNKLRYRRDDKILESHRAGMTYVQLSRKYDLSVRQIRRICAKGAQP
ncbi:MAG: hypothetical protein KJ725_14380 [Gammaproteobacteria bacterium]|nr:hypothetical protein [Gammaproteobacteria bacterium]